MALLTPGSIADIVGDNAKHQLSATTLIVRVLWLGAVGGAIRFGDTNVSASRGASIPSGAMTFLQHPQQWPKDGNFPPAIDLSTIYAYVPNSATLTISYLL